MKFLVGVIKDLENGWFSISVLGKDPQDCVASQGSTKEEALENIKDVISLHFGLNDKDIDIEIVDVKTSEEVENFEEMERTLIANGIKGENT